MTNTPFNRRNNECQGDLAAYMRAIASDNEEARNRMKRNLRIARREELTDRQKQMLYLYYECEMTMAAIGQYLGISKSTVSRTIARAERRLKQCLRYTL